MTYPPTPFMAALDAPIHALLFKSRRRHESQPGLLGIIPGAWEFDPRNRHCEVAKRPWQSIFFQMTTEKDGLLRYARNDDIGYAVSPIKGSWYKRYPTFAGTSQFTVPSFAGNDISSSSIGSDEQSS